MIAEATVKTDKIDAHTQVHLARTGYLPTAYAAPRGIRELRKYYEIIVSTPAEEVVIHADFGPLQVVVDSQGQWILMDFEYAALGGFADDLAGAEVRLEQEGYPNVEGFLEGYEGVRGALAEYESAWSAVKVYNLLAMLTYRLAHQGEEPPTGESGRFGEINGKPVVAAEILRGEPNNHSLHLTC